MNGHSVRIVWNAGIGISCMRSKNDKWNVVAAGVGAPAAAIDY